MSIKGIILAGGAGTRLYPATQIISKQLLPVYDKPMVYYALSTLMMAGIRDILCISTPADTPFFQHLLGDGSALGIALSYAVQPNPEGIAQAFIIAEKFLNGSGCALILGDNIFYGHQLPLHLKQAASKNKGATIFAYHVNDPQRYGVVEFDEQGKARAIEEKPKMPKSTYAVTGLYFYDKQALEFAKQLKPSARNELEITDLNNVYLMNDELDVITLGRGMVWLDTGTPESLLDAALFMQTLEKRQSLKIGCPEEIAYRMGFINAAQLEQLAARLAKSSYGQYLMQVLAEDNAINKFWSANEFNRNRKTQPVC